MTGRDGEPAARQALMRALDEVAPDMVGVFAAVAEIVPPQGQAEYGDQELQQLAHALVSLMHAALDGGEDDGEKRQLVLEAAVPALVAHGERPLDLVESHVAMFSLLGIACSRRRRSSCAIRRHGGWPATSRAMCGR